MRVVGWLLLAGVAQLAAVSSGHTLKELEAFASRDLMHPHRITQADAVFEARVVSVDAPGSVWRSMGDWAWIVTGHRFGLPEHAKWLEVKIEEAVVHKGKVPESHLLDQPAPQSVLDPPGDLLPGHRYVFFCSGTPEAKSIDWFADLADWPGEASATAAGSPP